MAIRNIVTKGDDVLRKKAKVVGEINSKILDLLDDMADTMYEANGVGLAAPQVGLLKRIAVIDTGDGLIELINPVIIEQKGEQIEIEGCLSIPDVFGKVKRPAKVVVESLNRDGVKIQIEAEELLAIALCHEIDHLEGILFEDKVIEFVEIDND